MRPTNRKYRAGPKKGPDTSSWSAADREAHETKTKLETPIAEMRLTVRVINTLEENDVIIAQNLMSQTYETLMGMKNFGDKTLTEVRAALVALGLDPPAWKKPPKPKPVRPKKSRGGGGSNPLDW